VLAAALVAAGRAGGAVPTVPVATVTTTIVGLTDAAGGGYDPPDPQVAAGPGFVVEMVNLAERVWRTDTGAPQLVQTIPLSVFYGTGADGLTDPRILWDTSSGRWLASISNEDQSSVMLAVSHGSDPTGDWSVYSFPAGGCADQPRLGVADGVIVLAADVFQKCEGFSPVLGDKVWVVNKQQAVAGATTVSSTSFGPDTTHASLQPVQSLSPTATEYVVGVDNPSSRVVHVFAVDGVPPAAVTMQPVAQPAILPLSLPPDGQQPHPNATVRTNDDRILDAVWEGGKLWFSANTGCIPDGDTALRACARVTEVSTDTLTVDWDVNLGQAKAYLYYPAIRPDASGNLVVVYGESSTHENPAIVVQGRTPDGTFTAPTVAARSRVAHLGDRYGDYFGAARDPVNPALIWVVGETAPAAATAEGWASAVASVQVTPAGATPPTVHGATPPRVQAQAVTARAGAAVRLSFTTLDDGESVSSNVTVTAKPMKVVFETATAVATVHASQVHSVVWRPAKKLRGAFVFCVQSTAINGAASEKSCATVRLK
jgi:hypothetical protein